MYFADFSVHFSTDVSRYFVGDSKIVLAKFHEHQLRNGLRNLRNTCDTSLKLTVVINEVPDLDYRRSTCNRTPQQSK